MYLCKYPIDLDGRAVRVGEELPDATVDALPIVNQIALLNRGWLVKLDEKGQEPRRPPNRFIADWNRKVDTDTPKRTRDEGGRLTGDVDEGVLERQRREDVALSPEGLSSIIGDSPKMPDFENMEHLPQEQRARIKAGKQVDEPLDTDAQTVDDIEVRDEPVYAADDEAFAVETELTDKSAVDGEQVAVAPEVEGFECVQCKRIFASARGLSVHTVREHGG